MSTEYKIVYDYSDVPTIKKFALDDSRIRALMGPFGSGKSSGDVMEILRRASQQKPSPLDGIKRSRWGIVRNCYDDQTEILTDHGWKLFIDVNIPGDRVATIQNGEIIYEPPNSIAVFPYKGEMIGFESELIDFLVTPDHELVVSTRHTRKKEWSEFKRIKAEKVYGSQTVRMKRDAVWMGEDIGLPDNVMEWLGFWYAEGSIGTKNKEAVITSVSSIEYTRDLFLRAGLFFKEWNRGEGKGINFILTPCEHYEKIHSLIDRAGKAGEKSIHQKILMATRRQIRAFLRGFTEGDGSIYKGTTRLYTSSKIMAGQLQEMAMKAGGTANIISHDRRGKEVKINGSNGKVNYKEYVVTLIGEKKFRPILYVNQKTTNKLKGWYKQEYDGLVFCAEMPFPEVVVRRNGKSHINSRTYQQLKDTTIKTVKSWLPEAPPGVYDNYTAVWRETTHDYFISFAPDVEIELMFRALDRPDQVRNLLSLELTGAWLNEYREIEMDIFQAIDGRIGRYPAEKDGGCGWYGIIMDSNPPDELSSWFNYWEKERPDNAKIFKQPSGLSPHAENITHLPKGYYVNLSKGKTEQYVRVYVHGLYGFTIDGKLVYECFNDNIHIAGSTLYPIRGLPLILGFDFALNPACVITQITPRGQLLILDELMGEGMGIRQFSTNMLLPLLSTKYAGMQCIGAGDPSGASRSPTDETTCYDVLYSKEVGLTNIIPAETNSLIARTSAVESFLSKLVDGMPGIVLSPNCQILRKGFNGGYRRKRVPGAENTFFQNPEKNYWSHLQDALQYACMFILTQKQQIDHREVIRAKLRRGNQHRVADAIAGF